MCWIIAGLFILIFLAALTSGYLLLRIPTRCPKCKRIMSEEKQLVLLCRCGHVQTKGPLKEWQ